MGGQLLYIQLLKIKKWLIRAEWRAVRAPAISTYGGINYEPPSRNPSLPVKKAGRAPRNENRKHDLSRASAWTDVTGGSSVTASSV